MPFALRSFSLGNLLVQALFIFSHPSVGDNKFDGSVIFEEMGEAMQELKDQYPDHPGWEEAVEFRANGTPLGEDGLYLLGKMDHLFTLLAMASEAETFTKRPPEAYTSELILPHLLPNRTFTFFVWTRINQLREDGDSAMARELLGQFRRVWFHAYQPGSPIELLTYRQAWIDRYGDLYKTLATAGDVETLKEQKAFLDSVPSLLEWIKPEKWYMLNSLQEMFSEGTLSSLDKLRDDLLANLKPDSPGVDEIRVLLKESKVFDEDLWTDRIREYIFEFYRELEPALDGPRDDYDAWMDGHVDRLKEFREGRDFLESLAYLRELDEKVAALAPYTKEDVLALDRKYSETVLGSYVGIMLLPYKVFDDVHRSILASERLLAVYLAADLYVQEYGQRPTTLVHLVEIGLLEHRHLIDPFSGEIFILQTETGWTPYSLGPNLTDYGGTYLPFSELRRGGEGDLLLFRGD